MPVVVRPARPLDAGFAPFIAEGEARLIGCHGATCALSAPQRGFFSVGDQHVRNSPLSFRKTCQAGRTFWLLGYMKIAL